MCYRYDENLNLNLVYHGWIGMDDPNNSLISIKNALKDEKRIKYHNDHLTNLLAAIKYVIVSSNKQAHIH